MAVTALSVMKAFPDLHHFSQRRKKGVLDLPIFHKMPQNLSYCHYRTLAEIKTHTLFSPFDCGTNPEVPSQPDYHAL